MSIPESIAAGRYEHALNVVVLMGYPDLLTALSDLRARRDSVAVMTEAQAREAFRAAQMAMHETEPPSYVMHNVCRVLDAHLARAFPTAATETA